MGTSKEARPGAESIYHRHTTTLWSVQYHERRFHPYRPSWTRSCLVIGALEVDLHVQDDLKSKFAEMTPVFKTSTYPTILVTTWKPMQQKRGSWTRKEHVWLEVCMVMVVISPLLKWYVKHGLKVTQIHQVVEYSPSACFQKFGDNISEARRAGDVDPEKKLMQPLYIEPVTSLDKCRVPFLV